MMRPLVVGEVKISCTGLTGYSNIWDSNIIALFFTLLYVTLYSGGDRKANGAVHLVLTPIS